MHRAKLYRTSCILALIAAAIGCSAPVSKPAAPAAAVESAKPQAKKANTQATEAAPQKPVAGPQLGPATNDVPAPPAAADESSPQEHTAFFRAETSPAKMPKVAFTKREEGLCKVNVGNPMPAIALPQVGGSGTAKLADLLGKKATVVVYWKGDRRMSHEELADLGPDVIEPFGKDGVAVVGIAVNETAASAAEVLTKAGAKFTNLLDADGKAFAQVGSERLPRTYVLDPSGKIVWFDIEYSLTTRRELHDALRTLTGNR